MTRRLRILWHAVKFEWPLKLLAVIGAAVFWFNVRNIQDPLATETITLAVRATNAPANVEFLDASPREVTTTIRGRKSAVEQAKRSLAAYVDLADQRVGSHDLPVRLAGRPKGVQVVELSHHYVRVRLDASAEAERPVSVQTPGVPADGCEIGRPWADPPAVHIAGPSSAVERVARVVAVLDVSGLSTTTTREVKVQPRDASGLPIPGVRVEPERVVVTVPIQRVTGRTLPVWPDLTNPPPGYQIVQVTVRPATVLVTGPPKLLATAQAVRTSVVDISSLRDTRSYEAKLVAPQGLAVVGATTAVVKVTVASSTTGRLRTPASVPGESASTPATESTLPPAEAAKQQPAAPEETTGSPPPD